MLQRYLKRILVAAGISLVIVAIAAVISLVSFLRKSGRETSQDYAPKQQEGVEFGRTTDQRGCINEGLRRGNKLGIFASRVENDYFVKGCLQSSRATPGFCDGVPSGFKNIFTEWDEKQCNKTNVPRTICTGILGEQIEFCEH